MYCPNCFSVLQPGVTRCSHCSFDTREYAHSTDALPLYTSLNDQYMIGRVLGQGGFGITYKALDTFKLCAAHRLSGGADPWRYQGRQDF